MQKQPFSVSVQKLKAVSITLSAILVSTLAGCAPQELTVRKQVVDHPGKTELIYYGNLLDKPGTSKTSVNGKIIYSSKTTVAPSIQSAFLLENTVINEGDTVLDIGTGSGVQAIFAAEKASKILATDISQDAIDDTNYNIEVHGLKNVIETRLGDLFEPLRRGEVFDVIIFNIAYPFDETSVGLWEVHERFFRKVNRYMKPDTTIFYQSGWIRNISKTQEMIQSNGLAIVKMDMIDSYKQRRQPIVYTIKSAAAVDKLRSWESKQPVPKKQPEDF